MIDEKDKDIPIWIVWGWTVKNGEMSMLNISLTYRHAKYTYEINKDDENYLRVWIEPTYANHSFNGRNVYPNIGAIDMMQQDISSSWQDRYARVKAYCSELIRLYNNKEKFRKLAVQFNAEFGSSQINIELE